MQAADMNIISENHKKQSHHWKKQIKRPCFQQTQQESNKDFENTP